jgi:aspartyl-tRNA(Asn)/glutamyl-tRNA(Gln) amidotransferase subunit A
MAPRLKGPALAAAMAASRTRAGAAALRALAFREYEMDRLLSLGPDELDVLRHEPRPVSGGQPRMWEDARLADPEPPEGRTTGRTLRARFAAGESTPVEVLEEIERRVASGTFGATAYSPFVVADAARARQAAEAASARYRSGQSLGPLDGLPVPVKDEVHMRGLPTHGGTAFLDAPQDEDGFAVGVIERGGGVIVGKTHTTEWGMSPVGINPNHSMPRNAHRPDHAGGGSSTGTAAAVALGLATVGLGSDGGGSIRIPACYQGLFGLKPTFQRIGRSGDVFGDGSVSVLGPIGASTADLADFMAVAAASRDQGDYSCAYAPSGSPPIAAWERAIGRGVKGARIGIPRSEWEDADPRVAALCMDALHALERDGATIVDMTLPHAEIAQAIGVLSIGPETAVHVRDFAQFGRQFGAELVLQLATLSAIGAQEYLLAQRARATLRRTTAQAMGTVDLIALPTTPTVAPRYPAREDRVQVADDTATRLACRYAFLANLTGYPSSSTPVGMVDGLPAGLQLVGDAWDEASVLAAMAQLERTGVTALPAPAAYRPL